MVCLVPGRISGLSLIKNETQSSDLESRVLSHAGDWRADNSLALKNKRRGLPQGPNLFSEVFALGSSIAFRWAAVSRQFFGLEEQKNNLTSDWCRQNQPNMKSENTVDPNGVPDLSTCFHPCIS
jgi:hypothetical protein